ncbi:hypothetical protein GC175_15800 [bacterium]|nr:hypothetical protein [bacterium]
MKANWIDTHHIYQQLLAAPDQETREQLYKDAIIQPWQAMMNNMTDTFQTEPGDPFGVARAWNWLLPEHFADTPQSLPVMEAADAWTIGARALAKGATQWEAFTDRLPLDQVTGWLILADPTRSMPGELGYTGAIDWTQPQLVVQYATPTEENLRCLPGAVVHEMHHLIRLRLFPWNMMQTSLAQYIVHEGMAELFATELFGEEVLGPYVTAISKDDLATARRLIANNLDSTGFDVIRAYVFGDGVMASMGGEPIGMPNYGGYAVGYHVVQSFLRRTGLSVAEATFLSAEEIVAQSGYFRN